MRLAEDLPLVLADRRRIVQVIGNLLSNAAQQSPGSSVTKVSAVREGGYVEVSVAEPGGRHPPRTCRACSAGAPDKEGDGSGSGGNTGVIGGGKLDHAGG